MLRGVRRAGTRADRRADSRPLTLGVNPIRTDGGFCPEPILVWCEDNDVGYVIGFAKNSRLKVIIAESSDQTQE